MELIAAAQMNSGPDKAKNLESAERLLKTAKSLGASLVGFPENFSWLGREEDRPSAVETLQGPTLGRMAELARTHQLTVLAGSILEKASEAGERFFNTSVLLGPDGSQLAVYRKIHLFDVDVGDGPAYRESAAVTPGNEVVCAETPLGKVGLSICYDLRFPELYRALSRKGAVVLTVPAAFTLMTGKDHWEVLLRARAIENQAYVLAPAQFGRHGESRMTYGHALIADPWGLVTARASDGEGLAVAQLDTQLLQRVRKNLPALSHRKL